MTHCRSWRLTNCALHQVPTLPGKCRDCWRPCFHKVPKGVHRCFECEKAIALGGTKDLKFMLLDEGVEHKDVLDYLTSDFDPLIREYAQKESAR